MALIGNQSVLHKSHAFFTNGTATAGAYAANAKTNFIKPSVLRSRFPNLPPKTSIPEGYNLGEAYLAPWKSGGLAADTTIDGSSAISAELWEVKLADADLAGVGVVDTANLAVLTPGASDIAGAGSIDTANLIAVANASADLAGVGAVGTADLSAIIPIFSTLAGSGAVTSNLTGTGRLEADIVIGASDPLSPDNLASAVWDTVLADHVDVGSTGAALNDAGSAGNPWAADLSSNNTDGTFGGFVQKLLSVAKFLGLK